MIHWHPVCVLLAATVCLAQKAEFPPGANLDHPLTANECVAIALWRNAQLEADLAAIPVAKADVIDARQIREPFVQMLFPVGPKRFEMLWNLPLDLLIQRPHRIRAAETNARRLSESLLQNGLNLARDVRWAFADVILAERRAHVASESAALRARIAELGARRLKAGDISGADLKLLEIDAGNAAQQAALFADDRRVAEDRLRLLMGLRGDSRTLQLAPESPPADVPALDLEAAFAARPDLKAAGIEIELARTRTKIEAIRPYTPAPGMSIKGSGSDPIRTGPMVMGEIPVLNRNKGGKARAAAEVHRLEAQRAAVRDRVEAEVRQAHGQLEQAARNLAVIRTKILPAVRESVALAEASFKQGDVSRLNVLESARQVFDAELREADALAILERTWAELERSMGKRP